MASGAVTFVLKTLATLIVDEFGLLMGVDKEMQKISSNLNAIQAVLDDAEMQQYKSRAVRDWLSKLTDIAYEIEDILDVCATHVSIAENNNNKVNLSKSKAIFFRHKIGKRMKKVCESLDVVNAERSNFHLREMAAPRWDELSAVRETGSILNYTNHIFGRDEEKEKIVDVLVNQAKDHQELSVLPIIGLGGLGKTTLAQLVFNDGRIGEHFEIKIWICVSDNFDLKTLLKAIMQSATKSGDHRSLETLDALQNRVKDLLNKKRFLLVLDDVWNDNQEKWCMLKNVISCGSRGSSTLVTTRLGMVADIMGSLPAHNLTNLSDADCWLLFKERAFRQEQEEDPNLVNIGKEIVKKCNGVPLAAKALGSLLRFKREVSEWLHVKESELWSLPSDETSILPALRLSYHNLPLELRQCFTYCAVFPKGTRIYKHEIILLWMSHGYVSSSGTMEAEDVGNIVWKELFMRSLFQDAYRDDWGTTFTLHDLIHDLAKSITENRFVAIIEASKSSKSTSNSRIREVQVTFNSSRSSSLPFKNFNRLRVWKECEGYLGYVPSSIGNLTHLRYLNLSWTMISNIPTSICSLWNLQTLVLDDCRDLRSLPKHTRKLKNLRYLLMGGCVSLSHMPPSMGKMTSLKRISRFAVGKGKGSRLGELQFLSLEDELCIDHLERVKNHSEAERANLRGKPKLQKLCLKWHFKEASASQIITDHEKVLEALEPHSNLKNLDIIGFRGMQFPLWMRKSTLENVIRMRIINCRNCYRLPKLGDLPHLKFLDLEGLPVKYIIHDDFQVASFPSLKELTLTNLPYLRGLSRKEVGQASFPSLECLTVEECSLLTLQPLPSLKNVFAKCCSSSTLSSFSKLENVTRFGVCVDKNITVKLSLEKGHKRMICSLEDALRGMKSLTTLSIKDSSLPGGALRNLTALETVYLHYCSDLVELPDEIRYLQSLKCLSLVYCLKLKCLPEALRDVTTLHSLNLRTLPLLTELPDWLGELTSLQELTVHDCLHLTSLPATILTNLQSLSISFCPVLERRYEKETGKDWHEIAHIPVLQIGYEYHIDGFMFHQSGPLCFSCFDEDMMMVNTSYKEDEGGFRRPVRFNDRWVKAVRDGPQVT